MNVRVQVAARVAKTSENKDLMKGTQSRSPGTICSTPFRLLSKIRLLRERLRIVSERTQCRAYTRKIRRRKRRRALPNED
jgi:hypothetical protein